MESYENSPNPVELTVHLLFGDPGDVHSFQGQENDFSGWSNQYLFETLPGDGSFVNVLFRNPDGEIDTETSICASVVYSHVHEFQENENSEINSEENAGFIVIYGGEENPDSEQILRLADAGWTPIEDDEIKDMFEMCSHLPPLAGIHNILILVGEPGTKKFQTWTQSITPLETEVPPFGRRLILDPINASTDLDSKIYIDAGGYYDERDINPSLKGSLKRGLPSVIIHSEIIEPGTADVVFWVTSLSDIDGIDMMAAGWAQIKTPEDFDPEVFEATERITLALATKFIWTIADENNLDEDGEPYIELKSCEIDNPAVVSPRLYHLLPDNLVEYCTIQRSLLDLN